MAALAAAAVLASTVLASTIASLAARVADFSGVAGSAGPSPAAVAAAPPSGAAPAAGVASSDGDQVPSVAPPVVPEVGEVGFDAGRVGPNGDGTRSDTEIAEGLAAEIDDVIGAVLDNVLGAATGATGDDDSGYEPPPLNEAGSAALERIIDEIDNDNDLGMSEGELDNVRDELEALDHDQREAVLAALSDIQLERLFHNVHSSGFWSNDWNDKERNHFYGLLSGISTDLQQRLSEFTDYFELYDSELDPRSVPIDEADFVSNYEAIVNLDLDEFLALRAHMWDHPELIEQSPFDWYADGCSIPGGFYPGALNGPCLLHDFAYTNARLAAFRFDEAYTDLGGDGSAEQWKQHADRRLRDDIADLPWWEVGDSALWADVVYTGVAVDFDVVGLPSGRSAFTVVYDVHYGPGFDPNLGQWSDDDSTSDAMRALIDLATPTAAE